MDENKFYDEGLQDIRMTLAMEDSDWYKTFKLRDHYIKLLIISYFLNWVIFVTVTLLLRLSTYFLFIVPNLAWIFLCSPFFIYKLRKLTILMNQKKEELVINIWNTKTKDINKIILLTGIDKIFIEYYLKKNGLKSEIVDN